MIKNKKKIAIVNIFYPPKAMGGATRIVVDEVSLITKKYGDDFEVVVFTADTDCNEYYKLNVYPYDGYRVYAVSVALTTETNWHCQDEKIGEIFNNFLELEQPDLVHFHSIQALTASILEVAKAHTIPHLVTVHDAWWISDHQFLIDQFDNVYPEGHPDPFEKYVLRDNVTLEQSIERKNYLKRRLLESNGVLAVSDTFRKIYALNGISNVVTNINGISNEIAWANKNTQYTQNVVCAHIGGMTSHKGFYIFEEAVYALKHNNIEVLVVDHSKPENYSKITQWGQTKVNIIGRVSQEKIADLYKKIDVLFAPSTCAESFGLVVREALACSCWVVGSNIGAIAEDITHENGFRINPTKDKIVDVFNEINQSSRKFKGLSNSDKIRYASNQVKELISIFNNTLDKLKSE